MTDDDPPRPVTTIPPDARLIRDFVNTVEWQVDADEWSEPGDLARWFATHLDVTVVELGEADLLQARRLREGLRALLLLNAGHEPLPADLLELNRALDAVPLRMRAGEDGELTLAGSGRAAVAEPLGRIVAAVDAARAAGGWTRLKACSRDTCRWAYWDGSRNGSARWCSMSGCGNFVKMRRRNRPEPPKDDALPVRGDRPRVPTMLDVAGHAGVSMKTVSNVVTGSVRVAAPTRQRVLAAIDELGYRPNLAARALSLGQPMFDQA